MSLYHIREFVQKYFVSDGMICDLAVDQPEPI